MGSHQKTFMIGASCIGLLVLSLLWGCAPQFTPHPVAPTYVIEKPTTHPTFGSARLMEDHVIVTGGAAQVEKVIAAISGASQITYPLASPPLTGATAVETLPTPIVMPALERKDRLDLSYLEGIEGCSALAVFGAERSGLVMDLYEIKDAEALCTEAGCLEAEVVARINKLGQAYDVPVFADLAYALSPVEGAPWIGEGSPWIGEGSPWIGEGSPWIGEGSPAGGDPAAAAGAFWEQWALGDGAGGIGLISEGKRTVKYRGAGVRIGVFDTHAYGEPGAHPINWVTPPFTLTVPNPELPGGYAKIEVPQFPTDDHGLFVAGLAHAVAPDAEIVLYRVLDEERRGDLWSLNAYLHRFISETLAYTGPAKGAVINMSLGSPAPLDWLTRIVEGGTLPDDVRAIESRLSETAQGEMMSLRTLVAAAHCRGIPVIAAAGNKDAPLSEIPAIFPEALAVASSNRERGPSCFTNSGEVYAPGGDGKDGCIPAFSKCSGEECDRYNLIGPVVPIGAYDPAGAAYWAGSSFSAPLVSGLAALLLDAGREREVSADGRTVVVRSWVTVEQVIDSIKNSADARGGVIHVPTALQRPE